MTCSKDDSFSARLEADTLFIDCASSNTLVKSFFNDSMIAQYDGASYSLLPNTGSWPLGLKNDNLQSYAFYL